MSDRAVRFPTLSDVPYAGLLALLVAAPFEGSHPWVKMFGLALTPVEMVLWLTLAVWVASTLLHPGKLQIKSPITWPSVLLLTVMLGSTWFAAGHPGEALRFCGRFASGMLIYFFVLTEVKNAQRLLGLVIAVVCTGTVVAMLGILEYQEAPFVVSGLASLKTYSIYSAGQLRASSTLQYPTIASMYLEIVFGLSVGLLFYVLPRSNTRLTLLVLICTVITGEGIVVTQTRSGLLLMFFQLILACGFYCIIRGVDRNLWVGSALFVLLTLLFGQTLYHDPTYWLHLTTRGQEGWYRAQFEVPELVRLSPGELKRIPITVANTGKVLWASEGETPFRVSYHWLQPEKDEAAVFDGYRTPFPGPVPPGENVKLEAWVLAPSLPGRYRLAWDILQEKHGLWFSTEEPLQSYTHALVEGPAAEEELTSRPLPGLRFRVDRLTLWATGGRMLWDHPVLGVGPDNFRLRYGEYLDLETSDYSLHSNNMYLEFFAGAGLAGGILFLWLIFSVCVTLVRARQNVRDRDFALFLGVAAAVLASLLHGLFDYFLTFTPTYIMIWTMWGAVGALWHHGGSGAATVKERQVAEASAR